MFVCLFLDKDLPKVGKVLCRVALGNGLGWDSLEWSHPGASDNKDTATGFSLLAHSGVQQERQAEKKLPDYLKCNKEKLMNRKKKDLRSSTPPPPIIPTSFPKPSVSNTQGSI